MNGEDVEVDQLLEYLVDDADKHASACLQQADIRERLGKRETKPVEEHVAICQVRVFGLVSNLMFSQTVRKYPRSYLQPRSLPLTLRCFPVHNSRGRGGVNWLERSSGTSGRTQPPCEFKDLSEVVWHETRLPH